ncbi:MAG: HAD-IA family hydrolase [Candidatus Micrarchaeota archaeon]
MRKNAFKAVVFDLDNTLVDFARMKERACDAAVRAMRSHGLKTSFSDAKRSLFALYCEHGIENKGIFQIFLKRELGAVDYKLLSNAIVAYRREENDYVVPYPGTTETLAALKKKKIKLAVLTDAPRLRAWNRLAAMGLTRYFDFVLTLAETKRRKPHSAPFNAVMKKMKKIEKLGAPALRPHEILFVGDSPGRDMAGAQRAGMRTCLARYGMAGWRKPVWRAVKKHFVDAVGKPKQKQKQKRVRPDFVIDDVRELAKIV